MTTQNEPIALLSQALDQIDEVLAGIREDQLDLPTPCRSWTVGQLMNHLVHDLSQYLKVATGVQPDWTEPTPPVTQDRFVAFRKGAAELLDAWRAVGEPTGTITLPDIGEVPARFPIDQQIFEFTLHAWDLAKATGQPVDFKPELGQLALDWIRVVVPPEMRGPEGSGRLFGPEVQVAADAPLYDRLAAFCGREPQHV
ncbi:TIGR03086 family metal-binding protein [Micromonospora sp. NBC_01699]|uniref:TIGR03086 family metal-binding protein n=1 Tax=Micromonospora sp. NBC_01699 TaxID=2975984 RepID=UPI002E32CC90|nr:TIGR03086 family metal-binding protein [Micromonospora sp. NBC_01699]